MIAFKSKVVNNEVVKEETLMDYMTKLYDTRCKDAVSQYVVRSNNTEDMTIKDLLWAKDKLCANKAKGVDEMEDKYLRND